MSVKAMAWVWDHAPDVKGSELLVLLALADAAHDDGTKAYPGRKRLADKTRLSERTVIRLCAKLVEKGVIRHDGRSHRQTNEYTILGLGQLSELSGIGGDNLSRPPVTSRDPGGDIPNAGGDIGAQGGDKSGSVGDIAASPNPSLDPSFDSSSNPPGGPADFEVLEGVYRQLYGRAPSDTGRAWLKALVNTYGLPRTVNALRGEHGKDPNPANLISRMERGLKLGNLVAVAA